MERGSDLTSFAAPRAPRDLAQPCDPRIAPDLARRICLVGICTVSVVVVKTGRVVSRVAQPNGVRLSCGAVLERSQTEDYLRKRGAVSFRRVVGSAASERVASNDQYGTS